MTKTRVGILIRESVAGSGGNQSADLQALTAKYQIFCKNVRALCVALQNHIGALQNIGTTRVAVAHSIANFSKNTPLWDSCGQMPGADRPADSVCSYASVYDTLTAKNKAYVAKYQQFVVSYVVEWEKTVTTRVNNGLKKVEEQRRELNHYQKKVEALRLSTNKALAQGKSVKSEAAEKLKRNEEKLINAKQTYNKMTSALCILMDEVAERSWRDLHHLLIKIVQFDMTTAGDEAKILSNFNQVLSKLKEIANTNGISPQDRLKDLGSLNPELLSTRPGGVSGFAIEADPSMPAFGNGSPPTSPSAFDTNNSMALPPGSVAPQGMGGFPVQVSSFDSNNKNLSRASSFSSYASSHGPGQTSAYEPPSTLSMLSISQSSAPPPTLDDVYGATSLSMYQPPGHVQPTYQPLSMGPYSSGNAGNLNRTYSAPLSGNLPPLAPNRTNSFAEMSVGSTQSGGGGYLSPTAAPPPMAPPPPPPMSGPPQQQQQQYGGGGGYGGGGPGGYGGSMVPSPSNAYGSPWGQQASQGPPPLHNSQSQPYNPTQYGQQHPQQPQYASYGQLPPVQQQQQRQTSNNTNPFNF